MTGCHPTKKTKQGVSIIEVLVATTISTLVVGLAVGIWLQAMQGYKEGRSNNYLQDEARYIIEYMSKELRMASNVSNQTQTESNSLSFTNDREEHITYVYEDSSIKRIGDQGGAETLNSSETKVELIGGHSLFEKGAGSQDLFKIKFRLKEDKKNGASEDEENKATLEVQTSVSSRNLEIP